MDNEKLLLMCTGIVGALVYMLVYIPFRKKLEKENKEFEGEIFKQTTKLVQEAFPMPDFEVLYEDDDFKKELEEQRKKFEEERKERERKRDEEFKKVKEKTEILMKEHEELCKLPTEQFLSEEVANRLMYLDKEISKITIDFIRNSKEI